MIIDWQSEYESVVRTIGSATYGKERWFYQDNGIWYDRKEGDYIDFLTLERRIYDYYDIEDIANLKPVDAIPVEFLLKYADENDWDVQGMEELIEDWRNR